MTCGLTDKCFRHLRLNILCRMVRATVVGRIPPQQTFSKICVCLPRSPSALHYLLSWCIEWGDNTFPIVNTLTKQGVSKLKPNLSQIRYKSELSDRKQPECVLILEGDCDIPHSLDMREICPSALS